MARLADRRIVVVGAGTRRTDDPDAPPGNGRAISVLAAKEGAAVACVDVDADAAGETARQVEAAGGSAPVVVGDVADEAACTRVIDESFAALGAIVSAVGLKAPSQRESPREMICPVDGTPLQPDPAQCPQAPRKAA